MSSETNLTLRCSMRLSCDECMYLLCNCCLPDALVERIILRLVYKLYFRIEAHARAAVHYQCTFTCVEQLIFQFERLKKELVESVYLKIVHIFRNWCLHFLGKYNAITVFMCDLDSMNATFHCHQCLA